MAIDRIKVKKEADKFLAAGKVERAIDELRKILDDNPKDMNTLNTIGDLYLQIRRIPEAVEVFRRLAIAYERDGFAPKATAILQKTMRAAPDDIDIAQRLADLYRQTNKIKEAVQVHLQVAEYFQKKGLIKRALEEFAKLVDLDPKNLKNKVRLADLYNKEGMKDRAAAIYLEVAESLAMEQMHAEANQILERAKAMVSTPQVYLTQSRLGVIQGDYATAAQHLREGLSSNARNPELLEALAEIELRSGNPDRALEALAERPALSLEARGEADAAADGAAFRRTGLEALLRRTRAAALKLPDATAAVPAAERDRWVKAAFDAAFPPAPPAKGSQPAPPPPPTEMESRLLDTVKVDPADLAALADARAKRVLAWLLDTGKADPARVFQVREGGPAAGPAVVFTLK